MPVAELPSGGGALRFTRQGGFPHDLLVRSDFYAAGHWLEARWCELGEYSKATGARNCSADPECKSITSCSCHEYCTVSSRHCPRSERSKHTRFSLTSQQNTTTCSPLPYLSTPGPLKMWTRSDVLQLLQLLTMVMLAMIHAGWCILIHQGS